jgi:hypothetical protein
MFSRKKPAPAAATPASAPPRAPALSPEEERRSERRQADRTSRAAGREIDAEMLRLRRDEAAARAEMTRLVKIGRTQDAKVIAKQVAQAQRFQGQAAAAQANVKSIGMQVGMAQAQSRMTDIMGDAAGMMAKANAGANGAGAMRTAMEYQKEMESSAMTQELMDEALDTMYGDGEVDDETDRILEEVLAKDALSKSERMHAGAGVTPHGAVGSYGAVPAQKRAADDAERAALQRRLAELNTGR